MKVVDTDIRELARARYEAACRLVGWEGGDPGPSARDPLTLTRRKVAYWLACGEIDGVAVPVAVIASVSPRSKEGIAGIVRQCVPWPGPRSAAAKSVRAAYAEALAGEPSTISIDLLARIARDIWRGSERGLGAPKGSTWKRKARRAGR